jgi:AraC family transcriptional regulator of adaptative response/methylated-DNA-[protein]-cysteine methyltransferase
MQAVMIELAQSSLGIVLVAITERGIRSVQIGDDPESLRRELRHRVPAATIVESDLAASRLAARVTHRIEHPEESDDLPLDIEGTEFQKSVWQALRDIPAGTTISYTELAERIGRPAAVRAVAHACAENAHAVLIPCHRAVRSDGGLGGYRWGLERKRALLEREATATAYCTA